MSWTNPRKKEYPLPLYVAEKYNCQVGRIRQDCAMDNGLSFWVAGDQAPQGRGPQRRSDCWIAVEVTLFLYSLRANDSGTDTRLMGIAGALPAFDGTAGDVYAARSATAAFSVFSMLLIVLGLALAECNRRRARPSGPGEIRRVLRKLMIVG